MLKLIVVYLIKIYQQTFSLDHGWFKFLKPQGQCRFYPSCSEYTRLSVEKLGVSRGLAKGFKRIIRCHPWSSGGYDPVK